MTDNSTVRQLVQWLQTRPELGRLDMPTLGLWLALAAVMDDVGGRLELRLGGPHRFASVADLAAAVRSPACDVVAGLRRLVECAALVELGDGWRMPPWSAVVLPMGFGPHTWKVGPEGWRPLIARTARPAQPDRPPGALERQSAMRERRRAMQPRRGGDGPVPQPARESAEPAMQPAMCADFQDVQPGGEG